MKALPRETRDQIIQGVRAGRDAVAIAARHQISPVTVWKIARKAGESKPRPGAWTEARIAELRRLCKDELPFSQIGAALGISKNQALGKAHRLGITNGRASGNPFGPGTAPKRTRAQRSRDNGLSNNLTRRVERRSVVAVAPEPRAARIVHSEAPEPLGLTLLELTSRTCKWPSGHPRDSGFSFCGHVAVPGEVYCEFHCDISYPNYALRRPRRAA